MVNISTKQRKKNGVIAPKSIVNELANQARNFAADEANRQLSEPSTPIVSDEKAVEEVQKVVEIKPKAPPVKMWVVQNPVTVDLHPSVSANIAELDAEIETYKKAIEQNQYARKRAIKGVLTAFGITPRDSHLNDISFVKTADDIYQLIVPQSDKLIER